MNLEQAQKGIDQQRMPKLFSLVNMTATIIPSLTILTFAILALIIRVRLGRWPVVYRDNFENGLIPVMEGFAWLLCAATWISPVAWIVSGAAVAVTGKRNVLFLRAMVYLGTLLIYIVAFHFDRTGFVEWFVD